MSQKYHFKSVNTNIFISSTHEDQPGQDVKTGGDVPNDHTVRAQLYALAFF